MAAPNYAAYDGNDDDELSLSETVHLWVEREPESERNGHPHPGLVKPIWARDFWRWFKRHIRKNTGLSYLNGKHTCPRKIYKQLAESDEYKRLLARPPFKDILQLKAQPLFLRLPEDRPNTRPAKGVACRKWLTEKMEEGREAKEKSKDLYLAEARKQFNCSKPQFERAWADACRATSSGWDSGGRPRKK